MDRPLWQLLLPLLLCGLALQRGAAGVALQLGGMELPLVAAYAAQTGAALATALGIWLGRRWVVSALIGLAVLLAISALLEGFWLGVRPPLAALAEIAIVALSTGALAWVLRDELEGRHR